MKTEEFQVMTAELEKLTPHQRIATQKRFPPITTLRTGYILSQ